MFSHDYVIIVIINNEGLAKNRICIFSIRHFSITIYFEFVQWKMKIIVFLEFESNNPKPYVKALNIFILIYHDVHFWMTLLQTLFCYLIDTRKLGLMEYVICKKISFCHRIMQRSLFYMKRDVHKILTMSITGIFFRQ